MNMQEYLAKRRKKLLKHYVPPWPPSPRKPLDYESVYSQRHLSMKRGSGGKILSFQDDDQSIQDCHDLQMNSSYLLQNLKTKDLLLLKTMQRFPVR